MIMFNFLLTGVATVGSIWLINKLLNWYSIYKKIKKKQKDVNSRKLGLCQKFQGMEIPFQNKGQICHLSGHEIHMKIKAGELLAVDILEAFQANAIVENNKYNFLADIIYEADVSSLGVDLEKNNQLMGWPLSISDSLCVEKYDSTFGLLGETFHPSTKDSIVIKVLRESGAIPAMITNVGQGDFSAMTSNPIIGRTLNSLDTKRTCGGSSGGLAVALATASCLIGVSNDIHGNIRIPASFCGVFGLKTSSKRISRRHVKIVGPKQNIIKNSIGAMARNMDDLVSLFRSLISKRMFELDPLCPPIPFDEALLSCKTPMKIGYYIGIGGQLLHPVPAVERAVMMAKTALEQAGHELVEYQLPNMEIIADKIFTKIMFSDGGQAVKRALKNEPIDSNLKSFLWTLNMPRPVKCVMGFVAGLFCRSGANWLSGLAGVSSVYDVWQLKELVDKFREEVLLSWEKEKLDGLICPVLPIVAPPANNSNFILGDNAYVVVYNILDYVAGSVPITNVSQDDIDNMENLYSKKSRCCQKIAKSQTDSLGMPVGVQCVALPWREEIALRIMKSLVDRV